MQLSILNSNRGLPCEGKNHHSIILAIGAVSLRINHNHANNFILHNQRHSHPRLRLTCFEDSRLLPPIQVITHTVNNKWLRRVQNLGNWAIKVMLDKLPRESIVKARNSMDNKAIIGVFSIWQHQNR